MNQIPENTYKKVQHQQFIEILIKNIIESCKHDDGLLNQAIDYLENTMPEDVKTVLSNMRDEKINTILNERS